MRWCWAACATPASCRAWLRSACASSCRWGTPGCCGCRPYVYTLHVRVVLQVGHSWVLWMQTLCLHPTCARRPAGGALLGAVDADPMFTPYMCASSCRWGTPGCCGCRPYVYTLHVRVVLQVGHSWVLWMQTLCLHPTCARRPAGGALLGAVDADPMFTPYMCASSCRWGTPGCCGTIPYARTLHVRVVLQVHRCSSALMGAVNTHPKMYLSDIGKCERRQANFRDLGGVEVSSVMLCEQILQCGLTGARFFPLQQYWLHIVAARMLNQAEHHAWHHCLHGTNEVFLYNNMPISCAQV